MIAKTFFGTMIQAEWVTDDGDPGQAVTKFFGLLRLWDSRAVWHKMVTDTTALEANVRFAKSRSAEVMFTFGEAPTSALMPGKSKMPTMDAWVSFVREIAATDGIAYTELYNEPAEGYWDGSPEELAQYCRVGYVILKASGKPVLSPSFTSWGAQYGYTFFDRFLAAGGGESCDMIAFHAYQASPEIIYRDILNLRALLKKHGINKPIWNTEYNIVPDDVSLRPVYKAQSLILQASLGVVGAVWDPETQESANDYTDPTTQTVADWLIGATVGPLQRDNETRYVTVQRPGSIDLELSWTEQSFPVLSAVRHFPAAAKKGCNPFAFLHR